jgi:hypothetical protein
MADPLAKPRPAPGRGFVSGERTANEAQPRDIIVDDGRALLDHAHYCISDDGRGLARLRSQRSPRPESGNIAGCQPT